MKMYYVMPDFAKLYRLQVSVAGMGKFYHYIMAFLKEIDYHLDNICTDTDGFTIIFDDMNYHKIAFKVSHDYFKEFISNIEDKPHYECYRLDIQVRAKNAVSNYKFYTEWRVL